MALPETNVPSEEEIPEEISVSAYRMYLLETRWKYRQQYNHLDGLLGRLDVAMADERITTYCYETDERVLLFAVEKGESAFGGRRAEIPPPPENSIRITVTHYRDVLEEDRDNCSNEISTLETMLEALEKAIENPRLRVYCYLTSSGATMATEEKDPPGFKIPTSD